MTADLGVSGLHLPEHVNVTGLTERSRDYRKVTERRKKRNSGEEQRQTRKTRRRFEEDTSLYKITELGQTVAQRYLTADSSPV